MATTKAKNAPSKQGNDQQQEMQHPRMRIADFQAIMRERSAQIVALLPKSVSYERFEMVAMIALQNNPDLLLCEGVSLFQAFRDAAQKQLMPDGREGVITPYNTKSGKLAKFNPMYQGMLRKALNDPAIRKIETNVVGENDEFEWVEGTEPSVKLKRNLKAGSGQLMAAYCLTTLTNGEIMLEVMDREQALAVKAQSRGNDSPWKGPFEGEMWRKAVFRRAMKWAPISQETKDALGADHDEVMDGEFTRAPLHADNTALANAEPPNPHQLQHQPAQTMPRDMGEREREPAHADRREDQADRGRTIEHDSVDNADQGGGPAVEGSSNTVAGPDDNPDEMLKQLSDELEVADSDAEIDVVCDEWRDRIGTMLPPDIEQAEKVVAARRKAVSK